MKVEPFERHPARYENWFERNRYAYESELQAVRKLLPEKGDGLEIGVGSGRFAAPLNIEYGIDPSEEMIKIAGGKRVKLIKGVAEALPFRDCRFDFALMVTTICFLDDLDTALREATRVIKPEGAIIIGFIDKNSLTGKFYEGGKYDSVFYSIATFYSVDEIIHHLKGMSLHDFSFTQTIFNDLININDIEEIKEGYGEGSFVVIKAIK